MIQEKFYPKQLWFCHLKCQLQRSKISFLSEMEIEEILWKHESRRKMKSF